MGGVPHFVQRISENIHYFRNDAKMVIVLPHYPPNNILDIVDSNEGCSRGIHFACIKRF